LTLRLEEDSAYSIGKTDSAVSPDMMAKLNSLTLPVTEPQSSSHYNITPMTSHPTCSIGPYRNTENI